MICNANVSHPIRRLQPAAAAEHAHRAGPHSPQKAVSR